MPQPDNSKLPSLAEILLARAARQASQKFKDPALRLRANQLESQNRAKVGRLRVAKPKKPISAPSSIKS